MAARARQLPTLMDLAPSFLSREGVACGVCHREAGERAITASGWVWPTLCRCEAGALLIAGFVSVALLHPE